MNPITPLTPAQTAAKEQKAASEGYFKRLLIGEDMFDDAILGQPNDMTMSSSAAIASVKDKGFKGWVGRTLSRALDWIQPNHGGKAVAGDDARAKKAAAIEEESGIINGGTS